MQGKMKVAVMTGVGRSAFEEREIPRPKAEMCIRDRI